MSPARIRGVKAGPLNHRITIQCPLLDQADSGEAYVTEWAEVCKVWAAIESLSGREWLASSEFRSSVSTRIRIRWRMGIDAQMRVLHGQDIYQIEAVLPQHTTQAELHLMCSTGAVTEGGQP